MDVTTASFQASFSLPSGSTTQIEFTFANALTNALNDRFMVIPDNHKCGEYNQSKGDTPYDELNLATGAYNSFHGYMGFTSSNIWVVSA